MLAKNWHENASKWIRHVQNVFCLAHQIISSTMEYSHMESSSQLLFESVSNAYQLKLFIIISFCWFVFIGKYFYELNVMKIESSFSHSSEFSDVHSWQCFDYKPKTEDFTKIQWIVEALAQIEHELVKIFNCKCRIICLGILDWIEHNK